MRATFLFVLLLLSLTSCREESETTITTVTGTIPPPSTVYVSMTSVVIDQNGSPISNATIYGLGPGSRSNPDGSLTIEASALSTEGTLVTVTAPGKWPERRILMPAGDGPMLETFILEDKVKAGTLNTTTGGIINLGEGFGFSLESNTIATDENGNAYTGPIDVYINHDAPEDRIAMLNSPGNVRALLPNGILFSLESYGMMDVSLESPEGSLLILDDSTPAEVKFPLHSESVLFAPNEIGFWVFDAEGFWLPSGIADLGPNGYIASITKSSGYNCAVARPTALITAQLKSGDVPITHLAFSVDISGGFSCWNATLDSDGKFLAWVAAGTSLDVMVTDICTGEEKTAATNTVNQGRLFDLSEDEELDPQFTSTSFEAAISSCGDSGLPDLSQNQIWVNGYGSDGGFVNTRPDGTAYVSGVSCGTDDVQIQAFTRDYKASSRLIRRTGDDTRSQDLVVCSDLDSDESFSLSIDGTDLAVTELAPIYWPGNGNFNWLIRAGVEFEGEEYSLLLNLSDPGTGTYATDEATIAIYRLTPGQAYGEGRVYVDPELSLVMDGTAYNATEGIFEGTFSATMNLQNDAAQTVEAVNLPVSGAFRIKL